MIIGPILLNLRKDCIVTELVVDGKIKVMRYMNRENRGPDTLFNM